MRTSLRPTRLKGKCLSLLCLRRSRPTGCALLQCARSEHLKILAPRGSCPSRTAKAWTAPFTGTVTCCKAKKSWTSTVTASCTGRSLKLLWVDSLSTKNFRQGSLFTGHAITVRLPAPRRRRYFPSASHRGPAFSGRALIMRPPYPVPRPSPPPRVVSRPWRRHVSHPRHRSCMMVALVRRPRRCVQRRPRGHLLRTPHRRLAHPCSRAITMSCASTRARTTSRCARWRLPRLSL